jgi:hypothetical protein
MSAEEVRSIQHYGAGAVLASTYRRVSNCVLDVTSSVEIVWSAANEKGLATQQI